MDAAEVTLHDAFCRADLRAVTAVCAFVVVDVRKVIFDGDSADRTFLFALFAGDAAVRAGFSGDGAFFRVGAGNKHFFHIRHDADELIRADRRAHSAADAKTGVDMRDAVFKTNRVIRADRGAVAETHAAEAAFACSAEKELCRLAAFYALIVHFVSGNFTVASALDDGDLFNNVLKCDAQKLRKLLCDAVGAGNAEIGFDAFSVDEGVGIAVTACIAAGSAVSTRQAFTDNWKTFILLDRHDL